MKEPGYITAASVAHQHGSVEEIDAAAADSQLAGVEQLLEAPHVTEAFVLQTCNRAERYVVSDDPEAGRAALQAAMPDEVDSTVRTLGHEESLRHLLRVAAGLESLVPGEDQILGQVRDAYEDARHVDGLGPVLEEAVTKAIHVGERARTETAINEGVVSLGSAAVELAERERDLEAATALVIGAGEIGTLAAKAVDARSDVAHLYVANRTVPHAEHVTSIVDVAASAIGLDDVASVVDRADLVVSATGSTDPIVEPAAFETTGDTVVIDIGQPRDIPPIVDEQPGTDVFDLDDLEAVTAETRASREAAAARGEIPVWVRVERGERPGWIAVHVVDRGPGIPVHELSALHADEETPLQHGSGLGLWLVRFVVRRLGGHISARHRDDEGSVVSMHLPLAEST